MLVRGSPSSTYGKSPFSHSLVGRMTLGSHLALPSPLAQAEKITSFFNLPGHLHSDSHMLSPGILTLKRLGWKECSEGITGGSVLTR